MAVKVCVMPEWYSVEALRAHMKKIREEDEDFKRRSSQCSKIGYVMKVKGFTIVKKKTSNLESEDETQKKSEDDFFFFEVVGGWSEKGRIFVLGVAAHSYFDRPTYE
ncbi:Transketolase-like protein 1 [Bienertia sinuspersici]